MSYEGRIRNGVAVFSQRIKLPEGTKVVVEPLKAKKPSTKRATRQTGTARTSKPESLSKLLLRFAGIADDLPSDLARNHDHYLHGVSKR